MTIKHVMTITAAVISIPVIFWGCGGDSDSADIKRARLVANENMELKKELEQKNKEIEQQKQLFEKLQIDSTDMVDQTGKVAEELMDKLAETSRDNERLTEENAALKERIAELDKQLKQ